MSRKTDLVSQSRPRSAGSSHPLQGRICPIWTNRLYSAFCDGGGRARPSRWPLSENGHRMTRRGESFLIKSIRQIRVHVSWALSGLKEQLLEGNESVSPTGSGPFSRRCPGIQHRRLQERREGAPFHGRGRGPSSGEWSFSVSLFIKAESSKLSDLTEPVRIHP